MRYRVRRLVQPLLDELAHLAGIDHFLQSSIEDLLQLAALGESDVVDVRDAVVLQHEVLQHGLTILVQHGVRQLLVAVMLVIPATTPSLP